MIHQILRNGELYVSGKLLVKFRISMTKTYRQTSRHTYTYKEIFVNFFFAKLAVIAETSKIFMKTIPSFQKSFLKISIKFHNK